MAELDRRRFLAGAALGGASMLGADAFAAVLGPRAAEAGTEVIDGTDPNFLEGRVTSVAGGTLVVAGEDFLVRRVRASAATRIWKARFTTLEEIAVDDRVFVRGVPAEGEFLAETVWANIVNLHVEIRAVSRRRLELTHAGRGLVGHLLPDTVVSYGGAPETRDTSRLRPGRHVQLIGAWLPGTTEVEVARVYAPL